MAFRRVMDLWGNNQRKLFVEGSFQLAEAHSLISIFKSVATKNTATIAQECREACGGHGFSWYSKIGQIRQDFEPNLTWEGDNNVLPQQTAKFLLDCLQRKFQDRLKKNITVNWVSVSPVQGQVCEATETDFYTFKNLHSIPEKRGNYLLFTVAMDLQEKTAADPKNMF